MSKDNDKRESIVLSESLTVFASGKWEYLNDDMIKKFKEYLENQIFDEEGNSISAETSLLDDNEDTKIYIRMLFKNKFDTDILDYVYFQGTRSYIYGGTNK